MEFEFENLPNKIKIELLQICNRDNYNLSPKTLYKNILNSTGNNETLAKIFDVPVWVIEEIKKHKN